MKITKEDLKELNEKGKVEIWKECPGDQNIGN